MNRRETLLRLLALSAAAPISARTQVPVRKLGVLSNRRPPTVEEISRSVFRAKLKQLGWVEGQNLLTVRAYADAKADRLPTLAEDLVRQRVDIIFATDDVSAVAAARATATIPIVFMQVPLPVEAGLIESFAKPGRNATGTSVYTGQEVSSKRHEFLRAIAPAAKRLSWIVAPENFRNVQGSAIDTKVGEAVGQLGYEVKFHRVQKAEDLEAVFSEIIAFQAQALSVAGSEVLYRARQRIADFALRNRLPCASYERWLVESGCILSYGAASFPSEVAERMAEYVDRILRGARPADLPVERPSRYELVINLKTAKTLGLTIPQSILIRADRVIE